MLLTIYDNFVIFGQFLQCRQFLQFWIIDIDYNSDNWEPEVMTIFMTWHWTAFAILAMFMGIRSPWPLGYIITYWIKWILCQKINLLQDSYFELYITKVRSFQLLKMTICWLCPAGCVSWFPKWKAVLRRQPSFCFSITVVMTPSLIEQVSCF